MCLLLVTYLKFSDPLPEHTLNFFIWPIQHLYLQENRKRTKSQIEDDLISLYVFGEEEDALTDEAEKNGGIISYSLVKKHHYKDIPLTRAKSFNRVG